MTMAMLGHSSSHAISDPSLPLMLLLLLLPLTCGYSGNRLEAETEFGQFMDELPITYRENLELLDNVLALDDKWSPIWSEKLKMNILTKADLDKEFCPVLWNIEDKVNTLHVVKLVKEHCWYSGMYVAFAVELLGQSVQCLLKKYTKIQLSVLLNIKSDWPGEEIGYYLELLVGDYQLIIDRLATVGASLTDLISLVKFYDGIRKQMVQYINNSIIIDGLLKDKYTTLIGLEIKKKIEKLSDDPNSYCDESSPTVWYDRDSKKSISLDIADTDDEVITNQTENSLSSTQPADNIIKQKILKKGNQLRKIFHKVFQNLILGKMPLEVWKQIFETNILE